MKLAYKPTELLTFKKNYTSRSLKKKLYFLYNK